MEESRSTKKFKENLIRELPFYPNNKETMDELKSQRLSEVLIHYLHWKSRIVPPRPRQVYVAQEAKTDKKWKSNEVGLSKLLKMVSLGQDIYPYHSRRAHKKGYTPISRIRCGEVDSWDDKDQLLNTRGFHHFHLNMKIQCSGLSERTDEVLFAFVTRDKFHAVGIFDHRVFEPPDSSGNGNKERERMWHLHERYTTEGMEPGTLFVSNPIMSSGHPMHLRLQADRYVEIVEHNDPHLDNRKFVNEIYKQVEIPCPAKYNLEWYMDSLDLCIYDKRNDIGFVIYPGPI